MSQGPGKAAQGAGSWGWLCAILVVAAGLRLVGLDRVPPGLSADEASNAYDGYCLLKTHQDRWGQRWPVVLRAFGDADYRPALMAYLTVPFQALLGPGGIVTASRLPTAIIGLVTVLCLYLFARQVFDERTGLFAALLLALCPWHVVISRLAHESGLTPLFPVLILLLLERAGVPFRGTTDGDHAARLRWPWMLAAGAAVGLSLYSYASAKLFVPALLLAAGVLYRRWLIGQLRTTSGRRALAAMVLAALVVAGPMLKAHLTQWDKVNARALTESLLHREPTVGAALGTIAGQYLDHFGIDWLLVTGHPYVDQSPRGFGQLNWYMLPLLAAGIVSMVWHRRWNRAYALLLAWLVLYPIASATTKGGVNAARAACGLAVFSMIGAIGLTSVLDRLLKGATVRPALTVAAVAAIVGLGARFAYHYFVVYPRDPEVHARYQAEFRPAMEYLRDRRDLFDHVFISARRSMSRLWHTSEAYIYPLVYLPIEPAEFRAMFKVEISPPDRVAFHYVARAGDFTFTIDRAALSRYAAAFPTGRILLMARPGEVEGGRVVQEIFRPAGRAGESPRPCLQLVAFDLARQTPRLTSTSPYRDGIPAEP